MFRKKALLLSSGHNLNIYWPNVSPMFHQIQRFMDQSEKAVPIMWVQGWEFKRKLTLVVNRWIGIYWPEDDG
jgi:hypothetical protein